MMLFGIDIFSAILTLAIVIIAVFVVFCVVLRTISEKYPVVYRTEEETYFKTANSKEKFPSLLDNWSVHLSIVVPAYDEEVRLPPMLDECLDFLQSRQSLLKKSGQPFLFEVIVVSDGSKDKTVAVAEKYTAKYGSDVVRILNLRKNRGKGGAVRLGVQSSRGAVILFADADGATEFNDLSKLESGLIDIVKVDYLKSPNVVAAKEAIVCGSRAHLEDDAVATRSLFRTILMYCFHGLVYTFAVREVRDTQCGFKLFTREAARACFQSLHVERWAFDVEILFIAHYLRIAVCEIGVNWTEIEGSKIVPVWSWLQMGRDLFLIWLKYKIGAWEIKPRKTE